MSKKIIVTDPTGVEIAPEIVVDDSYLAGITLQDSLGNHIVLVSGTSPNFTVSSVAIPPPKIVTVLNPTLTTGQSFSLQLAYQVGYGVVTWTASGLPAGLTINATTGLISGTPTTAGTYSVKVGITDSAKAPGSDSTTIIFTVQTPAPVIPAGVPVPSGLRPGFTETFDTLDSTKWAKMPATFGQTARPLVNENDHSFTSNGNLVLRGDRLAISQKMSNGKNALYGTGGVWTRGTATKLPLYHFGECVFQTDHGQGYWPAIWMTSVNGGGNCEFDLFEGFHISDPNAIQSTLWCDTDPGASYSKKVCQVSSTWAVGKSAGPQFTIDTLGKPGGTPHTLNWQITPNGSGVRFQTWGDGKVIMDYTENVRLKWKSAAPANALWDILLNIQLGGDWVGDPDGPLGYMAGPNKTYTNPNIHRLGYTSADSKNQPKALLPNDNFMISSFKIWS